MTSRGRKWEANTAKTAKSHICSQHAMREQIVSSTMKEKASGAGPEGLQGRDSPDSNTICAMFFTSGARASSLD